MPSLARKLASGSAINLVQFLLTAAVTFFLMPFILKSLGDRLYGFWTLIAAFIGYYGILDFGLTSAVHRHVSSALGASNIDEANRTVNTAFFVFSGLGIFIFLITIILSTLSPFIIDSAEDAHLFRSAILILGINMAIDFPLRVFGGLLHANLKFTLVASLQIVALLIRTILIVWGLSSGYKIIGLAWITVLSSIPTRILFIYFSKRHFPTLNISRAFWTTRIFKKLLNYSFYVFIGQLAAILRFKLDAFVIASFVNLVAVTHYRIASLMIEYFFSVMLKINSVLTPAFSRLDAENSHKKIKLLFILSSKISLCISFFIAFGFIVWGKPFIALWIGPAYLSAYPCLVVLSISSACTLAQLPSVNYLFGTSKHRFFAFSNAIEGVFNLVISIVLVQYLGILGVALGTAIPMIIVKLFIQPIYVCKVSSINILVYLKTMAKCCMFSIISFVAPLLISLKYATPSYPALITVGFTSLVVYTTLIAFLLFDSDELKLMFPNNKFRIFYRNFLHLKK